jgi:C4-dicarboxylate-specific signal transduction histidine kinase
MNNINKYLAFPEQAQCRILIFDSSALNATALSGLLGKLGYVDVSQIIEPRFVMPLLREPARYDTVLVDISVPDLEGLKLIYLIRREFSAAELPILAIADADSPEACNAALLAGANDYLVKPVDAINMALRVRNLLTINGIHNSTRNIRYRLEREIERKGAELNLLMDNSVLMATTRDRPTLIRHTLFEGRRLLQCDAASMYLVTEHKTLHFAMRTRDDALVANDIALFDPDTGKPNERYVSTYCALRRKTILIDDVYQETRFDLSGTREFDAHSGYHTVSLLTVPMTTSDGKVVGVLQFINKIDPATKAFIPFHPDLVAFVEALAAQAAVALDNLVLNEECMAQEESRRKLGTQLAHLDRQRSLENMSASLGHELSQPLTAILTNAQVGKRILAGAKVDPDQCAQMLDKIIYNTQRASHIVERIRGFIRTSKGAFEPVFLHQVVIEVVALLAGEARCDGVTFILPTQSTDLCVMGESVQISQILLNVLRNAMDAVKQVRRREIHVALHSERDQAVISVRDTGPGLEAQALARVGEPFFTTKVNGLGMGFSISRNIAIQLSGTLSISNADGVGAQVELRLPRCGCASSTSEELQPGTHGGRVFSSGPDLVG